jgi:3-hydroxyisobutyrate dehydrogenase-like beta-hydroxyacid dehydrogenase
MGAGRSRPSDRGALGVPGVMSDPPGVTAGRFAICRICQLRGRLVSGNYEPAFTVEQMIKDFDLITDAARTSHVPMPLAAIVRQQYEQAWVRGDAQKDFFVLCKRTAE